MRTNLLWLLIFGIISLPVLSGCSKNKNGETQINIDTDSIIAECPIDPLIADSIAKAKEKEHIAGLKDTKEILSYMDSIKDHAKYKTGIITTIAQEAPEYARKLLANDYNGFIIVDKQTMRVILYDKYGREQVAYRMACSKNYGTKHKKADSRTPEGFFSVEGIYDSTDWLFTDDNGVTSKVKGQFGPRFIRLKIPNTSQIGIHGTCAPWSIGGRRSHGCIRITNENILELVKKVEVGMPVIISPSVKDIRVNNAEGYIIPAISTTSHRMGNVEDYGVSEPASPEIISEEGDSISAEENKINASESLDKPTELIEKSHEISNDTIR